jgi:hypothetical protein
MTNSEKFQPTEIVVRYEMIGEAVRWVCNRLAYTFDRENMNPRSLSERLDDGIMGEIASAAVMQFLADNGRNVIAYDQIRKDEYKEHDPGWDVLTSQISFDDWIATTEDIKSKPSFAYSFSIKSSRIPKADNDDINTAIQRRDFKIFKKSQVIDSDITADFEVQVYYLLNKSSFNSSLKVLPDDVFNKRIDEIITKLKLQERYSHCFLSGAASRRVLINYCNSLPENKRYWSSNHAGYEKKMWRAPLTLGTSFLRISN